MFVGIGMGVSAGGGGDDAGLSGADGLNFQRDRYRLNGVVYASLMAVPGVTYSRTGAATAWRADGTLAEFAPNVPRITDKGVLIEGQRTNLLVWSQEMDRPSWAKSGAKIVADAAIAPNNTLTADKLVEDNSGSLHQIFQAYAATTTSSPYSFTFFVKAAERTKINFGANWVLSNVVIDLITGAVSGPESSKVKTTARDNGWWEITYTGNAPDLETRTYVVRLIGPSGSSAYTGDGSSGVYLWGAQLELAARASTPIITTGAAATVGADNLALVLPAGVTSYSAEYGDNLTATGPATPGPFDLATGRPWLDSVLRRIIFS